jgi:DNA-directed RNA polymerase subunit omega
MQSHLLERALIILPDTGYLVNVISRRVRQLVNGHRSMVQNEPGMGFADIALTELIEGKLGYERTEKFEPEPIVARRGGENQTDGGRGSSTWSDSPRP